MKNTVSRVIFVLSAVLMAFSGCQKEGPSAEMLEGTWYASDDYYYIFNYDNTGRCQDADKFGLDFEWTLTGDELEITYKPNGSIPKPGTEIYKIVRMSDGYMRVYEVTLPDIPITFEKVDE